MDFFVHVDEGTRITLLQERSSIAAFLQPGVHNKRGDMATGAKRRPPGRPTAIVFLTVTIIRRTSVKNTGRMICF